MSSEPTVHELFDLSGRTVLVTGAAGYLGTAFCRALAEAGAVVVAASSSSLERVQTLVEQLPTPDAAKHSAVLLDHTDQDACQAGFAAAVEQAGGVDILINNGVEACPWDLTEITHQQFARQQANSAGCFVLARCLRDHAVEQNRSGNVIMIGSMYGLVASYPDVYEGVCSASSVAYHALKGGVLQMTRHLAAYWAKDHVRVNCLSPGPFPNPEKAPPELVDRLREKSPVRRMGAAAELKGAIVFLASEASSYVTGQNLVVDGGWTAW